MPGDGTNYQVLHEGMPDWLQPRIREWIRNLVRYGDEFGDVYYDEGRPHYIELILRRSLDWNQNGRSAFNSLEAALDDPDFPLQVVNLCFSHLTSRPSR